MFHNQSAINLPTPSGEPGHQAHFREEMAQPAPATPKAQPEIHDIDAELILAQHMVSAGFFIRFV